MTASTVAPAPEPPALSQVQRIGNVFIAPSKTFTDLKRSRSWWLAWIVLAISFVAFAYSVDRFVGFRQVAENQLAMSPSGQEQIERLSPEQRETQMNMMAKGQQVIWYGMPIVASLMWLVIAALLWGTYSFGLGADLKFGAMWAIIIYAGLPGVIRLALSIVTLASGMMSLDSYNPQVPLGSSLAYYLTPADGLVLYTFAAFIDVFMFRTLWLSALAVTCVTRVKMSSALLVTFGWYLLFMLAMMGLTAATT